MAKNDTENQSLTAQVKGYAAHSSGRIQAQVSSFKDGLQVFDKVSIVRVRSRHSNLLIMEDYMPIIGEIDGSVDFIGKDYIQTISDVRGFFHHAHNVFFLLLKDTQGSSRAQTQQEKREETQETLAEDQQTQDDAAVELPTTVDNLGEEQVETEQSHA